MSAVDSKMGDIETWVQNKTSQKRAAEKEKQLGAVEEGERVWRAALSPSHEEEEISPRSGEQKLKLFADPRLARQEKDKEERNSATVRSDKRIRKRRQSLTIGKHVRSAEAALRTEFNETVAHLQQAMPTSGISALKVTLFGMGKASSGLGLGEEGAAAAAKALPLKAASPRGESGGGGGGSGGVASRGSKGLGRKLSQNAQGCSEKEVEWWVRKNVRVGREYMHVVRGLGIVTAVGLEDSVFVHFVEGDDVDEAHKYTEKQWRQFIATDCTIVADRVAWAEHRARVEFTYLKVSDACYNFIL